MMPTFPPPPLKFRTVGFPQYGLKVGMSDGTFLQPLRLKRAPSIPPHSRSLSPPFACRPHEGKPSSVPRPIRVATCHHSRSLSSSSPGVLGPVRVMLSHSIIPYLTPCASPKGTLRFRGIALIRSAFAVRERLGIPRGLPDFHCCSFPARHRPYPGGPLRHPVVLTQQFQASSKSDRVATHNSRLYQQYPTVPQFRGCTVRFMLRLAGLPCPPGWLRQNEVTCSSPCLLRYIVTPAFHADRYRTALGVRLNGRTGNLPSSGLSPNQLTAASLAAPDFHGWTRIPSPAE